MYRLLLLLSMLCVHAHALSLIRDEIITNTPQADGFGSQFQAIIAAVIYAELHNKKFVYTPFAIMEHNYENDPDFILKKEWLINFIDNFEVIDKKQISRAEINFKSFFDANVIACAKSHSLQNIRKIFRANKDIHGYVNNQNLTVAIHVRRPNTHDNRKLGTDTPDQLFLAIINQLRIVYAAQNPTFHIYSQGNTDNFKLYVAHDVIFHLDESVEDTFCAMVFADILVTGASSFSYTAALLSEGIVYYIPFWHAPLPHWISVDALLKK